MKKLFSLILAAVLLLTASPIVTQAEEGGLEMLHTEGKRIVTASGEEIILRGVNLGGWMMFEEWFTPVTVESGCAEVLDTLVSRFGSERAMELLRQYMSNFLTTGDIADIASMGFNCVRIPIWYRLFQSDDKGTWYLNDSGEPDFSLLDEIVDACAENGVYAIIDLHGVPGYQNNCDHCGKADSQSFFNLTSKASGYRELMVEFWRVLAEHYAGNPAVAAYDILNEPLADVVGRALYTPTAWSFFDSAYKAVRSADADHIVTFEATWRYSSLPDPNTYGWENVMYQLHLYDTTDRAFEDAVVSSLGTYDIPCFVGEFYPRTNATFDFVLSMFNYYSVSWCLWTYKGMNPTWSGHGNFFCRFNNTLPKADVYNDSFEEISEKWGECLRSDSGNFERTGFSWFVEKYADGFIDFPALTENESAARTKYYKNALSLLELLYNICSDCLAKVSNVLKFA
ncbi:MAG: glycoside hydrolase family 5 protein [Clostridia bacterium]|nr:glycoside hydrolase family 5 protein [Clostridia bacterium]